MCRQSGRPQHPVSASRSDATNWKILQNTGKFIVRSVDSVLRVCLGIGEFSSRCDCILRVSEAVSDCHVLIGQGFAVVKGEPILELHFWNEHLTSCQSKDDLFAWALCVERRIRLSLMLLADKTVEEDTFYRYKALRASLNFSLQGVEKVVRRAGFTIVYPTRTLSQRVYDCSERLLINSLIWAFHPSEIRERKRSPRRTELWISIPDLQRLYGTRFYPMPSNN